MSVTGDLWEKMGDLEEQEYPLLLHYLFDQYEKELKKGENPEAEHFFKILENGILQVSSCNLNRR